MIVGRMKKFYADVTLVNQAFVINPDQSVGGSGDRMRCCDYWVCAV